MQLYQAQMNKSPYIEKGGGVYLSKSPYNRILLENSYSLPFYPFSPEPNNK